MCFRLDHYVKTAYWNTTWISIHRRYKESTATIQRKTTKSQQQQHNEIRPHAWKHAALKYRTKDLNYFYLIPHTVCCSLSVVSHFPPNANASLLTMGQCIDLSEPLSMQTILRYFQRIMLKITALSIWTFGILMYKIHTQTQIHFESIERALNLLFIEPDWTRSWCLWFFWSLLT